MLGGFWEHEEVPERTDTSLHVMAALSFVMSCLSKQEHLYAGLGQAGVK